MTQNEFKYAFDARRSLLLKDKGDLDFSNWYSFCSLSIFIYNALKKLRKDRL